MNLDWDTKEQIREDINTIEYLISLKPFESINDTTIQNAIFTKIMICLRDLIWKNNHYCAKINFTDDIIIDNNVKDIESLITYIRNALCHIDSKNNKFNCVTLRYNII